MKYQTFFLILILIQILSTSACKKEVELEVKNLTCEASEEEYDAHPKYPQYQEILDQYTQDGITGITVVLSKPDEAFWMGTSGYANIEDQVAMNPCHLYHTASLTKSFIGLVVLQLIEEGKLSFDTPIADYLTEEVKAFVPQVEELTVKHLLQQTSGIPDVFGIEFFTQLMNDPERIYTTEELLQLNEGMEALYAPGSDHTYADPNFMLLSMIIDQIEGSHIESFDQRIFDPLAFENLHYHDATYPLIDGLTASYWEQYDDGKVENISDIQNRLSSYIIGSDGMIASPKEMTHFYQSVFESDLLGTEMLNVLKTDWVAEKEEARMNTAYSHGFMVIETEEGDWIGHAGLQIGASCYVFYNLETKVTMGVFTNMGSFFSNEKKELIYYNLWNDLREVLD